MSTLMLQILPIWFAALLLGVPLFVSMGLAAIALILQALGDAALALAGRRVAAQDPGAQPL